MPGGKAAAPAFTTVTYNGVTAAILPAFFKRLNGLQVNGNWSLTAERAGPGSSVVKVQCVSSPLTTHNALKPLLARTKNLWGTKWLELSEGLPGDHLPQQLTY